METSTKETQTLAHIETSLAQNRPFGDWRYIDERTWAHYDCRIEMLTEHLPIAKTLLAALRQASAQSRYRVIGDPVVRSAINAALGHFKLDVPYTPLDELEAVLSIAADHLTEDKCIAPLEVGAPQAIRIGTAPDHAWVWWEERDEDVLGQSFRRLFKLYNAGLSLRTPDDHTQKMLVEGTQLLSNLLPNLARSTLNHVHLVAVVEERNPSVSFSVTHPSIPGTIFLSPSVLKTPWQAAEYLLHEALHLKFIDLEHTHSMLRRGYKVADSPTIRPLWHRLRPGNSNGWSINRALTVLHVYTCLALFFRVVERRSSEIEKLYGPLHDLDPAISARRAFDRAHYLGHKIKQANQELGLAGQRFVDWLIDILNTFDPCPPPANSYVHLLLDLYDREAKEFQELIQASSKGKEASTVFEDASIRQLLVDITQNEVDNTHRLLSTLGEAVPPLPNFFKGNHALITAENNETPAEVAARFLSVRAFVSQTLRRVSPEAYGQVYHTPGTKTPGELVQEMVEHSGQYLNTLIEYLVAHK